jgi:glycerophosphoryl diester phosphodiesterase
MISPIFDSILPENWPLYMAHRGASTLAPENTLAAFALAGKLGCRGIEFDVHLCKSGELVVAHDHYLDRIAGIHSRIEDMTYDELKKVDVGSFFNAKFQDRADGRFSAERIPTLDMLLETVGAGMCLDIELKVDTLSGDALAEATARCLKRHKRTNCIISSFNPFALRAYKKYATHKTAAIYCPHKSVPFYMRHRECLYLSGADIKKPSLDIALKNRSSETGAKPVIVWTVDSEQDARTLFERGVAAIITNRIQDFLR